MVAVAPPEFGVDARDGVAERLADPGGAEPTVSCQAFSSNGTVSWAAAIRTRAPAPSPAATAARGRVERGVGGGRRRQDPIPLWVWVAASTRRPPFPVTAGPCG